jgi:hypothetical protein
MKRLIQLNLLLLVISSAGAQESRAQEQTNTLHVYDWKDLVHQHELSNGEVIVVDGMSVLKIQNTNAAPPEHSLYASDSGALEVSLLIITNSVIQRTYLISCEFKYENVWSGLVSNTNHFVGSACGEMKLVEYYPPSASGGDERINVVRFALLGTSNWQLYRFAVDRTGSAGLPIQLQLKLSLPGHGTVYLRPIKLLGVTSSWWSATQSGMVGGAVGIFGGIIGCLGGLLGCLAGSGKARNFVLMTTKLLIALGMILTITGIAAILCRQPFFVWYVFLLSGVIVTLIFSLNFPAIQKRYDDLEIRRMASLDI